MCWRDSCETRRRSCGSRSAGGGAPGRECHIGRSAEEIMTSPGFIHLHVHSAYSLLEGALQLGKLLDLAKADKQPALGIADTNNLFGALEFSEKAAGKGIQPLIGVELMLDFSAVEDSTDRMQERGHVRDRFGKGGVVLIAQ